MNFHSEDPRWSIDISEERESQLVLRLGKLALVQPPTAESSAKIDEFTTELALIRSIRRSLDHPHGRYRSVA